VGVLPGHQALEQAVGMLQVASVFRPRFEEEVGVGVGEGEGEGTR
jgi:hypothetical protein